MSNAKPICSHEGDRNGDKSQESSGAEDFKAGETAGKDLADLSIQWALAAPALWDHTADLSENKTQSTCSQ